MAKQIDINKREIEINKAKQKQNLKKQLKIIKYYELVYLNLFRPKKYDMYTLFNWSIYDK